MLTALLTKARERGIEESLQLGGDIVRARLATRRKRTFVFVSPPLSNTGAPQLLIQVVDEFADRYGSKSVRLLAPRTALDPSERVDVGVRVERTAEVMGQGLVRLQMALNKDDFVLLNTVAVSRNYLSFVLNSLESGRLRHAYWYVHEDVAQLPALAPFLFQSGFQSLIRRLMVESRLTLLVPSTKTKAEYDDLFGTETTGVLPFRIDEARPGAVQRSPHDYASLRFLISGKPTDGRKGHMIVLAAFHEFMKAYYDCEPGLYRPFTLTLLGMTDDYVAEQIRSIGSNILGDRLESIPPVPHQTALEITHACNAVICSSFNETGPLYVVEGMRAGHIVLRNDAGMSEQLDEGVNGFRIDSRDITQFARVLEGVLNTTTMSDERLQAMGRASQEIVCRLGISSYVGALEELRSHARAIECERREHDQASTQ